MGTRHNLFARFYEIARILARQDLVIHCFQSTGCPTPQRSQAGLLFTTRHHWERAPHHPPTHPRPPGPLNDWAKYSSGPSACQNFSLAPLAPISLDQEYSSAPSVPLKTQHHWTPHPPHLLKGALAPSLFCQQQPTDPGTFAHHVSSSSWAVLHHRCEPVRDLPPAEQRRCETPSGMRMPPPCVSSLSQPFPIEGGAFGEAAS